MVLNHLHARHLEWNKENQQAIFNMTSQPFTTLLRHFNRNGKSVKCVCVWKKNKAIFIENYVFFVNLDTYKTTLVFMSQCKFLMSSFY